MPFGWLRDHSRLPSSMPFGWLRDHSRLPSSSRAAHRDVESWHQHFCSQHTEHKRAVVGASG
eukprot:364744-Chlamydomonas_euryale.AAC.2